MILDYFFSKKKQQLTFSYIKENGNKSLLTYNVSRFKSFHLDPNGEYTNWNGEKCSISWVTNPCQLDIKTFIEELPEHDKKKILGKYNPKLYTFDIEVEVDPTEFPEPSEAKFPILTISVVNEDLNVIVMGTKKLDDPTNNLQKNYDNWLNTCQFYKKLGLQPPKIQYLYFDTEAKMLEYFLRNIVAKAPVLAGWNSIGFDWQYIVNRIKNYYPNISLSQCSIDWTMSNQRHADMKGNESYLPVPNHTLILDMMDIVGTFDIVVMPIKENLSLDYIASESPVGMHKIHYDGDLQQLYERDYATYVFYNAIDSVLVQLIDKCFKTLSNLYMQSLYCRNKISAAFSKIAISESLFFNYFFENNIKIVPPDKFEGDRGALVGAYVRTPTPGKWNWMTCNDFASLYPNTIITCNLSIENYLGKVGEEFTEAQIEAYRKDSNYFVSVNGCVYKNDKDYAFKVIQKTLKTNRNAGKYLGKRLDAVVMLDVEHIEKGRSHSSTPYADNLVQALKELGYDIHSSKDIISMSKDELSDFKRKLRAEITYYGVYEQSMKLMGNSMYGGSSHVAFCFFNINLANDITGEARNLIHMMESHIPEWFDKNWATSTGLHKLLDIKVDMSLKKTNDSLISLKYGDTDSLYMSYQGLLETIVGSDSLSVREKTTLIANINTKFLNQHNKEFMDEYYKSRFVESIHEFELETIAIAGIWLNVKKRYAQILTWKDGKYFDEDSLPMKVIGLEIIKSSYPKIGRDLLKRLVRELIETTDPKIFHTMNQRMQQAKQEWCGAAEENVELICPSVSVNNYTKYVINDAGQFGPEVEKGCPFHVRGLANYNYLRQKHNEIGDPLYGGKMRYYIVKNMYKRKDQPDEFFCFQGAAYPKWADKWAPIDVNAMFIKCVLDPFNRIMTAIGYEELSATGNIVPSLFDFD